MYDKIHKHRLELFISILFLFLICSLFFTYNYVNAAPKSRLNYKKATMTVGNTKKLKLLKVNKARKIKWKSSDKNLATVSKTGKVTAKKAGRVKISAKVGKKTFTCKIVIKKQKTSKKKFQSEIHLKVGSKNFKAHLYENDSSKAFLDLLPLTIDMSELNGNEKYYYLPQELPTSQESIRNIKTGDLMLYGSDCLVLFYDSFQTSYQYTKLGSIEDISGFADALGDKNVKVTFSK